jgi:hypothetical protein
MYSILSTNAEFFPPKTTRITSDYSTSSGS